VNPGTSAGFLFGIADFSRSNTMNFITINTNTISGALFNEKTGREIAVAKGEKSPVIMTGYIGAGETKGDDGKYAPTAFGRLPMEAAKHQDRLVLSISGGLRGVLFKAKEGAKYDYSGVVEDGQHEYPIFGRKVSGERGTFISLSSMERRKREATGESTGEATGGKPAQASKPANDFSDMDEDLPF
jgi:hypothetical protein